MKKAALILLICIYSLATMGFTMKHFYCCGMLKSVTVLLSKDIKQSCENGNKSNGCCQNEYQFFKVKDSHVAADSINSPVKYFTDLHLYPPSFKTITFAIQKTLIGDRSNAPPLQSGVSKYIYNCVFRI